MCCTFTTIDVGSYRKYYIRCCCYDIFKKFPEYIWIISTRVIWRLIKQLIRAIWQYRTTAYKKNSLFTNNKQTTNARLAESQSYRRVLWTRFWGVIWRGRVSVAWSFLRGVGWGVLYAFPPFFGLASTQSSIVTYIRPIILVISHISLIHWRQALVCVDLTKNTLVFALN